MAESKILFLNHKVQKCGVYEFGHTIGNVLVNSKNLIFFIVRPIHGENFIKYFKRKNHRLSSIIIILPQWNGLGKKMDYL